MQQRGIGLRTDPEEADTLRQDEPLLAELYSASITGRVATGPRAGRRIARVGDGPDTEDAGMKSRSCCAMVEGFSIHAGVGQKAAKLFVGSIDGPGVRTGGSRLPPLRRKNENSVRNQFAACDSEDSDMSWTPFQSSAPGTCQAGSAKGIVFMREAANLPCAPGGLPPGHAVNS